MRDNTWQVVRLAPGGPLRPLQSCNVQTCSVLSRLWQGHLSTKCLICPPPPSITHTDRHAASLSRSFTLTLSVTCPSFYFLCWCGRISSPVLPPFPAAVPQTQANIVFKSPLSPCPDSHKYQTQWNSICRVLIKKLFILFSWLLLGVVTQITLAPSSFTMAPCCFTYSLILAHSFRAAIKHAHHRWPVTPSGK